MINIKKIGSLIALSIMVLIFCGQTAKAETPYGSIKGQIEKDKLQSVQTGKISKFENFKIDKILKSQVQSKSGYKTQALTGNTFYETEPNDYIYNANILPRGDMVVGTFGRYDVDTYKITISQPSYIVVSGVMDIYSLSDISFILVDPNDNLIYSDKIVQNDHLISKGYILPAGVYYIHALNVGPYVTNDIYGLAWDIIDITPPPAPIVNSFNDNDTTLKGLAEAGSTITVYARASIVGTAVAKENGTFSVPIGLQNAGTILTVTATDDAGNESEATVVTVKDTKKPIINGAVNKTINVGEVFDALKGVTAIDNLDGNITSKIIVTGKIDNKKPGIYTLTYNVKDSSGNITTVIRKITVIDKVKPVISGATNKTININTTFNPKAGVTAKDNVDGNLTSAIKITGTVDTRKKGVYTLTYKVKDSSGNITTVIRKITVIDKVKPVISGATNKTIKLKSVFNPKTGVKAIDNVDGNLTSKIKVTGTVNTKKKGTYKLTYTVTDKSGNKAVVTRKITVK